MKRHLRKAIWLFPLYLLSSSTSSSCRSPSAGLLHFSSGQVDADTFVLTLPMAERQEGLALFVFIGGLSAATGMIIVATIAISTMVSNDLVMPVLLRVARLHLSEREDLTGLLLAIRRGTIITVLLLGYLYARLIGESYALVTIGLVSFAAAAQFCPAIIGGIFWKGASRAGAAVGLSAGFLVWTYTLLLPSFARSGWLPAAFVQEGAFGFDLLKPYQLFGLSGLDPISHSLFWSMLVNIGLLVGVSLLTRQSLVERAQAVLFVDVFRRTEDQPRIWRATATLRDLRNLLARFVGRERAIRVFSLYVRSRGLDQSAAAPADAAMVRFTERQLAGAIGAASARIMVASVVKEELPDIDQVMAILDEASQVIEYSRQLEEKSRQLEATSRELRAANERLKDLDRLKDEFVSTVSHELRTPLTSIRSFSEILFDNPQIDEAQKKEFLSIVISESERLTRLINDILDLAKMEADQLDWFMSETDARSVIDQALGATRSLLQRERPIALESDVPEVLPQVHADADRLTQVIVNLLSNAVKFCDPEQGKVGISARVEEGFLQIEVSDNGPGVPEADRDRIFEKFQQAGNTLTDKPQGTGLGLPICREIIKHFGGRIWVDCPAGRGARFGFTVPLAQTGKLVAAGGAE